MANRSGGATRFTGAMVMKDTTPPELDKKLAERADSMERGTPFDVSGMGTPWSILYDDDMLVTSPSEREWIGDVYKMVDGGGQPSAVLAALTLPLRSANLTIEKPDGDKGQTEFIREVLYSSGQVAGMKPDLVGIVSQMAQAIAVKRTYHEMVFTRRKDGRIGLSKVAWRPPQSCEPIRDRANGELRGFRQYIDSQVAMEMANKRDIIPVGTYRDNEYGYVRIPAARSLVHINGQHRDPVNGISDLAVTHWAWKLQQKILLMWLTFLDGTSLPKVLAYGDDPVSATKNMQLIASLRGSGVVGIERNSSDPSAKVYDVLETSGAGAAQFDTMMQYLQQEMTKSVLAGFLDLTSNATRGIGSYALSADQSGLFLTSRQSAAKELSATVNDQLIRPLVMINFGHDAALPRLVFEQMGQDQSDKAMQMLQQIGSAQNVSVPPGFIDLLVERVSQFLDLPDEKVEKLLEEQAKVRAKQAEEAGRAPQLSQTEQGQLTDKVNAAGDMIAAKQAGRPITGPQLKQQAAQGAQNQAVQQLKQDRREKQ